MTHGQSAAAAEAGERLLAEDAIRIEYVEARTEGPMAGYQPFTTDAELVLDPTRLDPLPSLAGVR